MKNLKYQSFVVLTFATVSDIIDTVKSRSVHLERDAIVEVAAVRVKYGEIVGHYHSFIAIDGYDARNIEFDDLNLGSYNLTETYLIGAPKFEDVIKDLHGFIDDSVLLVQSASPYLNDPFKIFKEMAKECGCLFDNSAITLSDVYTAIKLRIALDDRGIRFEDMDGIKIAQLLSGDEKESWTDIFADYDVLFNPFGEGGDRDRNDPLSWALAFAKFFVKLIDEDEIIDNKAIDKIIDDDEWLPF